MSIRKLVYSYFEEQEQEPITLSLNSDRINEEVFIGVKTVDGSDYQIDYGDGNIITKQSSSTPQSYNLPLSFDGSTKIYVSRDNVEELKVTIAASHDFLLSDLFGMANLKTLFITNKATGKISNIPFSVSYFLCVQGFSTIEDYQTRRSFTYVPMNSFTLATTSGTGLSTSEVDNLLEDLSLATWIGLKRVRITGVNEARSSASDAFVATLQSKGVTVSTNT